MVNMAQFENYHNIHSDIGRLPLDMDSRQVSMTTETRVLRQKNGVVLSEHRLPGTAEVAYSHDVPS
jgi:hypothetical protein